MNIEGVLTCSHTSLLVHFWGARAAPVAHPYIATRTMSHVGSLGGGDMERSQQVVGCHKGDKRSNWELALFGAEWNHQNHTTTSRCYNVTGDVSKERQCLETFHDMIVTQHI